MCKEKSAENAPFGHGNALGRYQRDRGRGVWVECDVPFPMCGQTAGRFETGPDPLVISGQNGYTFTRKRLSLSSRCTNV